MINACSTVTRTQWQRMTHACSVSRSPFSSSSAGRNWFCMASTRACIRMALERIGLRRTSGGSGFACAQRTAGSKIPRKQAQRDFCQLGLFCDPRQPGFLRAAAHFFIESKRVGSAPHVCQYVLQSIVGRRDQDIIQAHAPDEVDRQGQRGISFFQPPGFVKKAAIRNERDTGK